jgi:phasin
METMTDTENAFATAQYEPNPAAARDFVKKAAATAKERATTFHAGADKATTAVEQTVVTAVGEVAKLTRQAQQAAYEDAQAFFSGVDQLASAKSVGEVVQIYVDYMRNRSDVAIARARTARDLFGKVVASGANTRQKTIANGGPFKEAA